MKTSLAMIAALVLILLYAAFAHGQPAPKPHAIEDGITATVTVLPQTKTIYRLYRRVDYLNAKYDACRSDRCRHRVVCAENRVSEKMLAEAKRVQSLGAYAIWGK